MTPIAELTARYGISRPTLYSWFKLLAVQREKDGNKTLITDKDVKRLDKLHEYLNNGGKLSEYIEPVAALPVHEPKPVMQTQNDAALMAPPDILALQQLMAAFQERSSPLDVYRDLDEAAANGWQLTTGTLEKLLAVRPKGRSFDRLGYHFECVGKSGREKLWQVNKYQT